MTLHVKGVKTGNPGLGSEELSVRLWPRRQLSAEGPKADFSAVGRVRPFVAPMAQQRTGEALTARVIQNPPPTAFVLQHEAR